MADEWTGPAPLRVTDDFGEIGKGTSRARYVRVVGDFEFIVKGPSLSPDFPFIALNELVCARVADTVGVPVPDYRTVDLDGDLLFGSAYIQRGNFVPAITAELLQRCGNRDKIYELVVMDTWVRNTDRHDENLLVRVIHRTGGAPPDYSFMAIDHGLCPIWPGETPADLASRANAPFEREFVRLPYIREGITDPRKLRTVLDSVTGLEDDRLRRVLRSAIPPGFAVESDVAAVERFLIDRKPRLRQIFQIARAFFPNLGEGAI